MDPTISFQYLAETYGLPGIVIAALAYGYMSERRRLNEIQDLRLQDMREMMSAQAGAIKALERATAIFEARDGNAR